MGNPNVRPLLHFFPEETQGGISEAWQGTKWRNDMAPEFLSPMVRVRRMDFYIYEPTLLTRDRRCMPFKWFKREGSNDFWCEAYCMEVEMLRGELGWSVHINNKIIFNETELVLNGERLLANPPAGVPRTDKIWGTMLRN